VFNRLQRTAQATVVFGLLSLVAVASASAEGVPQISPAPTSSVPGYTQVEKLFSLVLTFVVLYLVFVVLRSLITVVEGLRTGDGGAGRAAVSGVVALIVAGLIITQGTGFLTAWTNYFS